MIFTEAQKPVDDDDDDGHVVIDRLIYVYTGCTTAVATAATT